MSSDGRQRPTRKRKRLLHDADDSARPGARAASGARPSSPPPSSASSPMAAAGAVEPASLMEGGIGGWSRARLAVVANRFFKYSGRWQSIYMDPAVQCVLPSAATSKHAVQISFYRWRKLDPIVENIASGMISGREFMVENGTDFGLFEGSDTIIPTLNFTMIAYNEPRRRKSMGSKPRKSVTTTEKDVAAAAAAAAAAATTTTATGSTARTGRKGKTAKKAKGKQQLKRTASRDDDDDGDNNNNNHGEHHEEGATSSTSVEEIPVYHGPHSDETGLKHGLGRLTWPSTGVMFEGQFVNGVKCGPGKFNFQDNSDFAGIFRDDEMNGPGTYRFADGSRLEGEFTDGELNGLAREFNEKGHLLNEGQYRMGKRVGNWTFFYPCGGRVVGRVSAESGNVTSVSQMSESEREEEGEGERDGMALYLYPDIKCGLVGEWKDGVMLKAKFALVSVTDSGAIKSIVSDSPNAYSFDAPTDVSPSDTPLLRDPFETRHVEVRPSTIANGGEGLFMLHSASAGDVVAFYSGVRLTHDTVDGRSWDENANALSLDDDEVIDVPPPFDRTDVYCASLGHKVNHSHYASNAEYWPSYHPRFGACKCIRLTRSVESGQEILVNYGYDTGHGAPDWYTTSKETEPHAESPPSHTRPSPAPAESLSGIVQSTTVAARDAIAEATHSSLNASP